MLRMQHTFNRAKLRGLAEEDGQTKKDAQEKM